MSSIRKTHILSAQRMNGTLITVKPQRRATVGFTCLLLETSYIKSCLVPDICEMGLLPNEKIFIVPAPTETINLELLYL